ncbi:YtxH domain-containing protein [Calderihabitans maritimus]|uniref:YtxH domain-containing protein n=1 Tax=Calderihabitans maritimus TaxID=1246530 RepID=A0A1Z5HTS1_9FIRM|nr:hypothetical protein [Calderihabitans maritimus]GAW92670.1 hypothetical protein Desca_2234 [Calderihabitans maritimus]
MFFRGFFNGFLTGGIIGALASYLFIPQKKLQVDKKMMMGKSRRLQRRARRVMKEVSDGINELLKK